MDQILFLNHKTVKPTIQKVGSEKTEEAGHSWQRPRRWGAPPACGDGVRHQPAAMGCATSLRRHRRRWLRLETVRSRRGLSTKATTTYFSDGGGLDRCRQRLVWRRWPSSTQQRWRRVPEMATGYDGRKSHNVMKYVIIGSIVGAFVFVCLPLALFFCQYTETSTSIICIGNNLTNNQNIEAFLKEYGSAAPKRYTYSEVKKITNTFKEKLGQGGYGTVFKGILSDGQVVAVKILRDSKGDGGEFINEVASISRTSHVNIVTLLGFCIEGSRRALIYDFMCNGSLEKLLSEKPKTNLEWEKLYQIALGIARGLEYLHRGCNTRIVHFDIKPHNILLDEDFRPKISDFGLAKLCLQKESIISIAGMRGTVGYIAPEVFSRNFGVVSSKSDVYSYGMMVLEMAEGRENPNMRAENNSDIYFPHWIYEHLDQKGGLLACGVTAESEDTVRKMILVGLWCIQTMPQNRPSMSQVIEMLEGSTNSLHVPPKPHLSSSPFGSLLGTTSIQDTCGIVSSIQSIVVTS